MKFNIDIFDNITVISIKQEINIYNAGKLKSFLYKEIEKSQKKIVLNFKEVNFIDSSGIGVLLVTQKMMKQNNGIIAIANLNQEIKEVFRMSLLDQIFPIFDLDDLSKASTALKKFAS